MTSDLTSATLITLVSMCILSPTASEAMAASKRPQRSYDLRFDISNPDYPGIHVHIASNGLRGHGGLQTTSEVMTSDLTSATLITLVSMCILPLTASEAMAASKQPWRSYDLRFEISNLEYPGIHVHIVTNGLRGHGDLQTTSEVI